MSEAYGPSGGRMLRRALLFAIACVGAAWSVPRYFGVLRLEDIVALDHAPPQQRPSDAALPQQAETETFRAGAGNQFFVTAAINGYPIHFMVDTGATFVSLTPQDARAIGYDLDRLDWSATTETANGRLVNAPVVLKEVRLGGIAEYNVPALVMRAPGGLSLLGMSFLSRVKSWKIRDGVLTVVS